MEISQLQKLAAASKFDARTTYGDSVGSGKDLENHRLLNSLAGAGIPTTLLARHDPANGAPDAVDWAQNPVPSSRKKTFSQAHKSSLESAGGFLVSSISDTKKTQTSTKGMPSSSSRNNQKGQVVDIITGESTVEPKVRQKASGKWQTSYQNTCTLADERLEQGSVQRKQGTSSEHWKSNYQLMHEAASKESDIGRAAKQRYSKRQVGVPNRSLRTGIPQQHRSIVPKQLHGQLQASKSLNGMGGQHNLLSNIDVSNIANCAQVASEPESTKTTDRIMAIIDGVSLSTSAKEEFGLGPARRRHATARTTTSSRLPGFAFD